VVERPEPAKINLKSKCTSSCIQNGETDRTVRQMHLRRNLRSSAIYVFCEYDKRTSEYQKWPCLHSEFAVFRPHNVPKGGILILIVYKLRVLVVLNVKQQILRAWHRRGDRKAASLAGAGIASVSCAAELFSIQPQQGPTTPSNAHQRDKLALDEISSWLRHGRDLVLARKRHAKAAEQGSLQAERRLEHLSERSPRCAMPLRKFVFNQSEGGPLRSYV
jgi:hypothetical protein